MKRNFINQRLNMDKKQQKQKQLVLLFGCTGKSGYHVANRLLEDENYPVRIVVRDKNKLQRLFKERQVAFESVIQGDLNDNKTLQKAFEDSKHFGRVKVVISALGAAGAQSQQKVQQLQYKALTKIMKFSKDNGVSRFILISAAFIQRPWNPIPVIISTMVPNVYHYKTLAENFLKLSGLDYTIVRPPQLRGGFEDVKVTGYNLSQGDRTAGHISRRTLSNVVVDSLKSKQIPQKVTFQCYATKQKVQEGKQIFSTLKPDTQNPTVNASHRLAKYTYWMVLALAISGGAFYLWNMYYQTKQ